VCGCVGGGGEGDMKIVKLTKSSVSASELT
jgi:hypothetical protein